MTEDPFVVLTSEQVRNASRALDNSANVIKGLIAATEYLRKENAVLKALLARRSSELTPDTD